jgi:ABC-type transport system involved in multi-copper enzyme maturation permease subunit
MNSAWIITRHTWTECLRRRIFVIVPVATLLFLSLFALGSHYAFKSAAAQGSFGGGLVNAEILAGSTLLGLSMFVSLFLASALAIFLNFAAIRGDAEQGVLQQIVVRPVARSGLLLGRLVGASVVCTVYVLVLYGASVTITQVIGGWRPDDMITPAVSLVLGVAVVAALSLLGSVFLAALPNGIMMFMVYGAGLMGGFLGQLGKVLNSGGLEVTARILSWLLPFEALYQSGLERLTSETSGVTGVVVRLGPLGGAEEGGAWLLVWSIAYILTAVIAAMFAFARRDI